LGRVGLYFKARVLKQLFSCRFAFRFQRDRGHEFRVLSEQQWRRSIGFCRFKRLSPPINVQGPVETLPARILPESGFPKFYLIACNWPLVSQHATGRKTVTEPLGRTTLDTQRRR
jgi:hypothetical protein